MENKVNSKQKKNISDDNKDILIKLTHLEMEAETRKYIKKAYKLSDEEISTLTFLFWHFYTIEKDITSFLAQQIVIMNELESLDLLNELSLTGKIKSFKKTDKNLPKKYFKYVNTLMGCRNQIFHFNINFDELKYGKQSITNPKTRLLMVQDYGTCLAELNEYIQSTLPPEYKHLLKKKTK